jgi:MoxR-like ATPase
MGIDEERVLQRRLEGLEKKYKQDRFNPMTELPRENNDSYPEFKESVNNSVEGRIDSSNNLNNEELVNNNSNFVNENNPINDVSLQGGSSPEVVEEFRKEIPERTQQRFGFFNKTLKGDNVELNNGREIKNEISKKILPVEGVSENKLGENDLKGSLGNESRIIKNVENKSSDNFTNRVRKNSMGVKNRLSLKEIEGVSNQIKKLKTEVGKALIGQEEMINSLILGLMCNAHVLVEGVPGIAKTLAIRALAAASGCDVKRIQFTVDMLPTDIIGLTTYTPDKGFETLKGPIFTNFLIADEINRAPPKTQSALIEGMQEKQVTIGRDQHHLPDPFFVMATENPIENSGVYPLPEAQIDRFLFKVLVGYPEKKDEWEIMESNMTLHKFEDFKVKAVINPKQIKNIQQIVKKVYLDDSIKEYILSIVRKTRDRDFDSAEYLTYGSSPRASIGLFIASKARALMMGRNYVLPGDVKAVVYSVLRHRIILSYKATIDKVSSDAIINKILESVSV